VLRRTRQSAEGAPHGPHDATGGALPELCRRWCGGLMLPTPMPFAACGSTCRPCMRRKKETMRRLVKSRGIAMEMAARSNSQPHEARHRGSLRARRLSPKIWCMVTPICDKCRRRNIVSFKVEPGEPSCSIAGNRSAPHASMPRPSARACATVLLASTRRRGATCPSRRGDMAGSVTSIACGPGATACFLGTLPIRTSRFKQRPGYASVWSGIAGMSIALSGTI
jgi:hypothetical protein